MVKSSLISHLGLKMYEKRVKKPSKTFPILNLPDEPFFVILGFCSYDEVANLRLVCRKFDLICQRYLNHGYKMACTKTGKLFDELESLLPKEESDKEDHPLYFNYLILNDIKFTGLAFGEKLQNLCCFYPGKILDEIFDILRVLSTKEPLLPIWDIEKELDDLTDLAESHFDYTVNETIDVAIG